MSGWLVRRVDMIGEKSSDGRGGRFAMVGEGE